MIEISSEISHNKKNKLKKWIEILDLLALKTVRY